MDREKFISLSEAATLSGLSAGHLRFLVSHGEIAGEKIGRNWVTTKKAVADYVRNDFKRSRDPRKRKR